MRVAEGIALAWIFAGLTAVAATAAPSHLTCEHLSNPVGIDAEHPRLAWWVDPHAQTQMAYRVEVDGGRWDSGWVVSGESVEVPLALAMTGELERVEWRVRTRTDRGESDWSEPAYFVTGLRRWRAQWITGAPRLEAVPADKYVVRVRAPRAFELKVNGKVVFRPFGRDYAVNYDRDWYAEISRQLQGDGTDHIEATHGAVWERVHEVPSHAPPAFCKRFRLEHPVRRATLAICGLGFYEATLDGRRIGEKRLDPVPTNYDRRVNYSVYELGELAVGEHELRVLLGHGWYDVFYTAVWNWDSAPWRDRPKLLAELHLEHEDGRREVVATDTSWREVGSPIRFDCIREGEVIGPAPALDELAILAAPPRGELRTETLPPTRVVRELKPVRMRELAPGSYLVDFGENVAGWLRLELRHLAAGDVVTVRYDERVEDDFTPAVSRRIDAHFKYANSWCLPGEGGFQTDRYLAGGLAAETYEPRFTYNGFRYVWVTGLKSVPKPEDFTARVLQTDFAAAGRFDCSSADLLDILRMADRSYRGNFVNGFPTDCPHREKNGWTGDASLTAELAQYCYENTAAYEHWLGEVVNAQRADGRLPGIVPTAGWGYDWYGPVWDTVITALPEVLKRYRGDRVASARTLAAARRYVDNYAANYTAANGLVGEGYGDWCAPNVQTPPPLIVTSYFLAACEAVGRPELARQYREAVVRELYRGDGLWANGTQTAQACALKFGLATNAAMRASTVTQLVAAVELAGGRIDFGLVGSKLVFRELSEAGRTDLAYRMVTRRDYPSFLYWRDHGGTTFMEEFDPNAPSQFHVMMADVVAWAYQYLAGIRGVEDGFRRLLLAPEPVAELDFVDASVDTPYGTLRSAWRRTPQGFRYEFTVPPGCRARVRFAGCDAEFGAGEHRLGE